MQSILIAVLLLIIVWLVWTIDQHFAEHLNGFWTAETMDGPCILYLDSGNLRLIEANSVVKKGSYSVNALTWWGLGMRTYSLKVNNLTSKSNLGKQLQSSDLRLDLYPIEGTCVLHDSTGDILTLVKDNQASVSLLL